MKKKKTKINFRENPLVFSVDPGGSGAFSMFINGKFIDWGIREHTEVLGIFRAMKAFDKQRINPNVAPLLVIENQFVKPGESGNIKTSRILTERRMRWQVCAELLGWDVEVIFPSTWQAKTIRKLPGKNTKERSILFASQFSGRTPPTHDVADAFCIGYFWIQSAIQQSREER